MGVGGVRLWGPWVDPVVWGVGWCRRWVCLLDFLGEVKEERSPPVGSPFQVRFGPRGRMTALLGSGPPFRLTPTAEG